MDHFDHSFQDKYYSQGFNISILMTNINVGLTQIIKKILIEISKRIQQKFMINIQHVSDSQLKYKYKQKFIMLIKLRSFVNIKLSINIHKNEIKNFRLDKTILNQLIFNQKGQITTIKNQRLQTKAYQLDIFLQYFFYRLFGIFSFIIFDNYMSRQKIEPENYLNLLDQNIRMDHEKFRKQSKHNDQYFSFFQNAIPEKILEPTKNTDLIKMLQDRGILTKFDYFQEFNIQILSFSPNYEVLEIQLQWGYYKLKANVLNILGESVFHSREFSKGANTKVYHIQEQSCGFSIKCIRNKNQQQQFTGEDKIKALKEYFLNRVASALECGPYMSKQCGFDILFTEHCVQFTMETCTNVKLFRNEAALSLKNSLYILHRMRIVHFDIKPQNVMWSNHFKREVYIDFGLSQVVKVDPGFVYSTVFKGSQHFCSREMSALLFSYQMGQVDIYYNDVFGLIKTIKNYNVVNQFLEEHLCRQKNSAFSLSTNIDQIQNDLDPRENKLKYFDGCQNHLRKIIILKYYVYTKCNDLIKIMFEQSEQCKLIFSNQILDFIKDNSDVFYLQQFYKKYIDDSLKTINQFGRIDQWVNSVYPKQDISLQKQSPYLFLYNCIKLIAKKDSRNIEFLSRKEFQQFILLETVDDIQIYFQCFMKYISFINNVHGVTITQKEKYFQYFAIAMKISIEKNDLQNSSKNRDEEIIYKYLKQTCKFILEYYINGNFIFNNPSFGNRKRIQLISDILQHVFFFALLQTSQALQYLNKIYDISAWSDVDKTHLLLEIYILNDWNFVSFFTQKCLSFQIFERWVWEKIRKFGKNNLDSLCKSILDHQKENQKNDKDLLLNQKYIKTIEMLKRFILKNKFLSQIKAGKLKSLIKIRRLISQQIPYSHNKGLFSIYMHLLIIFNVCFENQEEYRYICQIFKRNLCSEHLYNSLFFVKLTQITKIKDNQGKIKLITHILKNINFYNAGLIMVILCKQLKIVQAQMKNIPMPNLLASNVFLSLVQELQKAALRLDFRGLLVENQHQDDNKIMQFKQYIYCYFSLKSLIDWILRRPSSLDSDLVALKAQSEINPCERCRTHITFQFIRLKISQIILLQPEIATQMLLNQFDAYFQFFKMHRYADQIYYHLKIYSSVISRLSIIKCSNIRHLQIVRQFYRFSKEKKILEKYFSNRENPNIISLTLIAILQVGNLAELIYFLRQSFKYIRYCEHIQTLCRAISEYRHFFSRQASKLSKSVIISILANLKKQSKKLPLTAAFYFSYLKLSETISEKYYYLYRICQLMGLMPQKMISYFYVEILLLIVSGTIDCVQDNFIFSSHFGKKTKSRRLQRKKRVFNNRIIKLLCVHYQSHRNVQIVQFKIKKSKNQKKNWLIDKCRKMKAFKLVNIEDQVLLLQPVFK